MTETSDGEFYRHKTAFDSCNWLIGLSARAMGVNCTLHHKSAFVCHHRTIP